MNKLNTNLETVDPKINEEFYCFDEIESFFIKKLKYGRLLNSYIFYGIKGVGKATFAFRLARYLLNQTEIKDIKKTLFISKENKTFKSVANLTHPDFLLITPNDKNNNINIDTLDKIQNKAYTTTAESNYKIIIIDSVDDISTSKGFSTLLKILEDCPKQCIFLLISHSLSKVPTTIKSRCQKIYFNPIDKKMLKKWFSHSKFVDEKNIEVILNLSNGSLGKAIEIINTKNYLKIYNQFDTVIQNIEVLKNEDIDKLFSLYDDRHISIENFLLIIEFQISKYIKELTIQNSKLERIEFLISLFFEINKKVTLFKSLKLDKKQLLNILKSILLNHSKNYN